METYAYQKTWRTVSKMLTASACLTASKLRPADLSLSPWGTHLTLLATLLEQKETGHLLDFRLATWLLPGQVEQVFAIFLFNRRPARNRREAHGDFLELSLTHGVPSAHEYHWKQTCIFVSTSWDTTPFSKMPNNVNQEELQKDLWPSF